jgi:hypothetical protein
MNVFNRQITSPKIDYTLTLAGGTLCLLVALILPHGQPKGWGAIIGAVNVFNGWRLKRKISASNTQADRL